MATLTAEATLNTTLAVECGHHIATPNSNVNHVTEARKAVSIFRSSKQAEEESDKGSTFQTDPVDLTSASGMGSFERILDYDQYPLTYIFIETGYITNDYVTQYDASVTDKQFVQLQNSRDLTDSGRIRLVFDFTEYYACTPTTSSDAIVVTFTAKQPTQSDLLETRTTSTVFSNTSIGTSEAEYTVTLDTYDIENGFVSVWFKVIKSNTTIVTIPDIQIKNVKARIKATGKTKASITPVTMNDFTVVQDAIKVDDPPNNTNVPFERDSIIAYNNIDLSSWPSTLQTEQFKIDSLVNFTSIQDEEAATYDGFIDYLPGHILAQSTIIKHSRAQATENENPLETQSEQSPATHFDLIDRNPLLISNNSWTIGQGITRGYAEWDTNLFSGFPNENASQTFSGATVSVWWYGTTIPITFIHADDPSAYYNVSLPPSAQVYSGTDRLTLVKQGDRSIQIDHSTSGNASIFSFRYPSTDTQAHGNTARNTVQGRWNDRTNILTTGWNNFTMSFTTGSSPTIKAYFNGVACDSTVALNIPEAPLLDTSFGLLSDDLGILSNAKTSIHAQYNGTGSTATGWNLSSSYPIQHGTFRGEQGAYFFVDDNVVDLDIQSNRTIFRNVDGTPTTAPKIGGQTPKIFISGNYKNIDNNGTPPDSKVSMLTTSSLALSTVDTIIGGAPTGRIMADSLGVGYNRDVYEADGDVPVITFNKIPLTIYSNTKTRTDLSTVGIELAYVYPPQGTFQHGFVKSKLLLDIALVSGNVAFNSSFTQSNVSAKMTRRPAGLNFNSSINLDTTTGRIHLFNFPGITFNSSFTQAPTSAGVVQTATVGSMDASFGITAVGTTAVLISTTNTFASSFGIQATGHLVIKDDTAISLPSSIGFNTTGNKIHVFVPPTASFPIAFTTTSTTGINIDGGAVTLATSFTDDFEGGIGITSGKVRFPMSFTTTQSGDMRRGITATTLNTSFTLTKQEVVFRKTTKTLASSFAFTTTGGRIHIFVPPSVAINTSIGFDTTGNKIHVFKFPPRTFNISTDMNPNTGRIHIFNFPATAFNSTFTFDRVGGIQQLSGAKTLAASFTKTTTPTVPFGTHTFSTAFTLSQPTVEVVKQSNKITVGAQTRTRIARQHLRTIQAERLETQTEDAITKWSDVNFWRELLTFASRKIVSHRVTATQDRTIGTITSNRTLLVETTDTQETAEIMSATYVVNTQERSISLANTQTRTYATPTQTRSIGTDVQQRTIQAERLT